MTMQGRCAQHNPIQDRLDALIASMSDGSIDEADRLELEQQLLHSEAAQIRYAAYQAMVASLRWKWRRTEARTDMAPRPARNATSTMSTLWCKQSVLYGMAVAALFALAMTAWFMFSPDLRTLNHVDGKSDPSMPAASIATLTNTEDAVFAGESPQLGANLQPGPIQLQSGKAQIMFASDAVVDLTGPCEFVMIGENLGKLTSGSLSAYVPKKAHGFSIQGPDGTTVTDLGTQFEAHVNPDGALDVIVLEGSVAVNPPAGPVQRLTAGQSRRVVDRHAVQDPGLQQLAAWRMFCQQFSRESGLLAYYTFDDLAPVANADDALVNDASGHDRPARCNGARVIDGPLVHTRAVEFKTNAAVDVALPGVNVNSFTLMTTVRIDALPMEPNSLSLLQTDGWNDTSLHWNFQHDGRIGIGLGGNGGLMATTANPVIGPAQLGRWIHLAVVADAPANRITFYLDGRSVAVLAHVHWPTLQLDSLALGGWHVVFDDGHSGIIRTLVGAMDTFAIFDRPLDSDTIARWALPPSAPVFNVSHSADAVNMPKPITIP